jgi:hypothetical protein
MRKIATIILGLGSIIGVIKAETLAVLPGTSIQAKIDEAAAGDIIAIFGGTYNQNVTVNKAVRLVELNGQEVSITGSLRFEGVADCPPFDGFTVGSVANRQDIEVIDTTGLVLSNLDHTAGRYLHVRGDTSQVEITDSSFNEIQIHGGQTDIARSTAYRIRQIAGSLVSSDVTITRNTNGADWGFYSEPGALQTVLYRVKTQGSEIWVHSRRNWVGYCQIKNGGLYLGWNTGHDGERKFVVVGTEVDRADTNETSGVIADGRAGSIVIANCWIHGIRGWGNDRENSDNAITVRYPNHPLFIQNNHLEHLREAHDPYSIRVHGDGDYSQVRIRNNYIQNHHARAVMARFGALVQGNVLRGATDRSFYVQDGVTIAESDANTKLALEDTDPGFELVSDPADPDGPGLPNVYRLAEGSVLRDAGTPNPLYNDRDGSRNDAGASGGSWYDPEGWTTDNPVVISFDLTPELVLEGADTEVTIEGVRAVSKP